MNRSAFTLIELLVVIAIIGIISTLSSISFLTAREKAKISKGLSFEKSLLTSIGDEAVGILDFDECTSDQINDLSGSGNNGTLINAPAWETSTPSSKGCSLTFDGSAQYANISNSASLKPGMKDWTVSFWIYRLGQGTHDYPQIIGSRPWTTSFDLGWAITTNTSNQKLHTHFADGSSGWDVNTGPLKPSGTAVALNTWQHWVVVFERSKGKLSYYLNGSLDAQYNATYPSSGINQTNDIYIGREVEGANLRQLNARLDSVHVYAKSLSAEEIQQIYTENAPSHPVAISR